MKILLPISFILFFLLSCSSNKEEPLPPGYKTACSNFLVDLGIKSDKLIFTGCTNGIGFGTNLPAQTASYKISGKDVKFVEQMLISRFKILPLKFACCGWDTPPTFFQEDNIYYTVWMSSDETLEKDWDKIQHFYVNVEKMWESP